MLLKRAARWIVGDWLWAALLFATVSAAIDALLGKRLVMVPVVLIAPLGLAAFARARTVIVAAVYSIVLAVLLGWPDGIAGERRHYVAIALVGVGGAIAVWLAAVRQRRDDELREARPALERASLLASAFYAGQMGTWGWNPAEQRLEWDAELERLFGATEGTFEGSFEAWIKRLHPEDRRHVLRSLRSGIESRSPFRVEYRCIWPDGSQHWLEGIGEVHTDAAGNMTSGYGVVANIDERVHANDERERLLAIERAARERADYLATVGEVLGKSLDLDELIQSITSAAVPELAEWCSLVLTLDQPREKPIVALTHADPEMLKAARRLQPRFPFRPDAPYGAAEVIRTGRTQLQSQIDEELLRTGIEDEELREVVRRLDLRSVIIVPLPSPLGVLGSLQLVRTSTSPRYTEADVDVAEELAHTIGTALNNALLYRRQRRASAALDTLQRFTGHLAVAVTVDDVISIVVQDGTAGVDADRGVLYLLGDDGLLHLAGRMGFAQRDTDDWDIEQWQTLDLTAAAPVADAVRTRSMIMIDDPAEIRRRYPFMANSPSPDSAVIVLPLELRNDVFGGLYLAFKRPHSFSDEELSMLQTLAGRSAGALERARLYDRQRATSLTLQRRLLPALPTLPEWLRAGALYQPATGGEVGGDWYQLALLEPGCCLAALGDAVGRGVPAAAAMGQLRAVLTGAAGVDPDPASVLAAVDGFAQTGADTRGASLVYTLIQKEQNRLRYACAGHPPPVLMTHGSPARLLEGGRRSLLGLPIPPADPTIATTEFGPGDTLILYSDGLIERRDQSIDVGLGRLTEAAERLRSLPPEELCDALLDDVVGNAAVRDDIAILAVHRT